MHLLDGSFHGNVVRAVVYDNDYVHVDVDVDVDVDDPPTIRARNETNSHRNGLEHSAALVGSVETVAV